MKKTAMSIMAAMGVAACGSGKNVPFSQAFPSQEQLTMDVSSSGQSQPLTQDGVGNQQQGLAGDLSGLATVSLGAAIVANGLTLGMLASLKFVTDHKPTTETPTQAVWGPHDNILDKRTWKLTATRTAPNAFEYVLESKATGASNDAYEVVVRGAHTVSVDASGEVIVSRDAQGRESRRYGEGHFTVIYAQKAVLPTQQDKHGSAAFEYAQLEPESPVSIGIEVAEYRDAETVPHTLSYKFIGNGDKSGSLEYAADSNVHWWYDATRPAEERVSMKTRWNVSGGRADVRATGGDLTAEATLSECWTNLGRSTYLAGTDPKLPTWGSEAADCAFIGASFVQE